MPRTQLSRASDTRRDLIAEIRQRMREKRITNERLGRRYGVTGQAMSYRIKNLSLNYDQIVDLMKVLEFPPNKILLYASGGRYRGVEND